MRKPIRSDIKLGRAQIANSGSSASNDTWELINDEPRLLPPLVTWTITNATLVGPVSYSAYIDYTDHGRNDNSQPVCGTATSLAFSIDFGSILQGGVIHVALSATVQADETGDLVPLTDQNQGPVLGTNPAKDTVRSFLNDMTLQVIAYKESKFRQFDNGIPVFGPPNGFGLMQLDTPAPTAREIWDWKQNATAGRMLLATKRQQVQQHFNNVYAANPEAPSLTPAQLKLAIYQYYNGGFYWQWDAAAKSWQRIDTTGYADDALRIENLVAGGTLPPGWN